MAIPVLTAGVHVGSVSNISLVSVGALIGVGGAGQLFTEGFQTRYLAPIVIGVVLTVLLALVMDLSWWGYAKSPRRGRGHDLVSGAGLVRRPGALAWPGRSRRAHRGACATRVCRFRPVRGWAPWEITNRALADG